MKTPASKTIGGMTFHVGIIPALTAIDTVAHLANVAQPIVGDMMKLRDRFGEGKEPTSDDLADALTAVARAIGGADATARRALIKDLASVTQVEVEGKLLRLSDDAAFNRVFSGENLQHLIGWIVFAATENFGPFLRGLLAK